MISSLAVLLLQRVVLPLVAAALALSSGVIGTPVFSSTCTSSTPVASRPTLRPGSTGSCVTVLQRSLAAQGLTVNTDGVFTAQTDLAVRRYQAWWQLLRIDGVVGTATWTRLVQGGSDRYSISRGPNRTSRVMLTFDDCPKSLAAFKATVLAAESLGIRLALFPYGQCREWGLVDPAFGLAHGHYVFNHSYSHPDLAKLSLDAVRTELRKGPAALYGRPPYGSYNATVLTAFALESMRVWTWTVDTQDWTGKSQADVVASVLANARAGDTVLMHAQHAAFNSDALAKIKSGLTARGLALCHNNGAVTAYPAALDC